jgi:hypothetical protein
MTNLHQMHEENVETAPDDWTLTTDQMVFMLQYNNPIAEAYANENMDYLRQLETSAEYKTLFGAMSFDEAYDRYECTLEDASADA